MDGNSNDESFIQDYKRAALGIVNGVFFYNLVWPYLALIIMKLVFQSRYETLVDTKYYVMYLILMILTSAITLIAGILIANPKLLKKAYHKIERENIKLIFKCFGIMLAFSYFYNLVLYILGVDITGGNANQSEVLNLIKENAPLAFISMVILAPISEEVTYRYFLFGGLRKINKKWAIVISGFVFMCVHAVASFTQGTDDIVRELLLLPPYMFSGMVLAYSYDKTSNLAVSTSTHALNNLISFIISLI